MDQENQECCPKFIPEKWDQKTFNWNNKPFVKETIPTLFHIPFPPMIGKKIKKMWAMIEFDKKAEAEKQDILLLFRDPSAFKSEMYMSTTDQVANANNVKISGTFVAKVFTGSYNAVPKFIKEMDQYLAGQNKKAKDYYIHYAYCPKCAQKYGNNYLILFAQV